MNYCPACDSSDATVLGDLGMTRHLRCRDCGCDYSEAVEDSDDDEYGAEQFEGFGADDDMECEGCDACGYETADCDDFDDRDALASAGFGTDEDYGYFGGDDY